MTWRTGTSISTALFGLCAVSLISSTACSKKKSDDGATPAATDPGKAPGSGANPGKAPGKEPVKAPARGPEHSVYSLVDNRLAAHLSRGGGFVANAGSAGFAKYVRFGNTVRGGKKSWELRQAQGDVKVARMSGKTASVFLPLTQAQAAATTVRLRVFSSGDQPLSMRVNSNKDLNAQVATGWSTIEVAVPGGQLKEGENELVMFFRSGVDVAWIQVGGSAAPADGVIGFYDGGTKALTVPDGGGMSWYLLAPDKAKLTADLADGACEVGVLATSEDGTTAEGKLTGLGSAVDLAPVSGKAIRLDLTASGCPTAALANASLVVDGEAAKPTRGDAPKYVILFVMDSLRADRVRAFNPDAKPEAPTFDKLAETSAVFEQFYVQGNESRVSHASIWTSLYPVKHRYLGDKDKLDPKWTTIDEVAKKSGKFVAGASANGYIRPSRGFGSAWDKFSNHIEEELGLKAIDLWEKGKSFIDGKKEPWFLYVGTVDTHVSWRAKEPWLSKLDPGYKGRFDNQFSGEDAAKSASLNLTEREKEHIRALYDSNVSYQDDVLRQMIEQLQAWGIWDQTMLIITADHGDEQWEDGRVGHGASSRDMLVHVPLVIHYPPMIGAGKLMEGAESIDITPTVADALGVAMDPEWQGESLVPLAGGVGRGYGRLSLSSKYEDSQGIRMGDWKINLQGSGTPKLYNLAKDTGEQKDIYGEASSEIGARMLLDPSWILRQWHADWKKSQWGNAANVTSRFAADLGE